MHEYQLKQIMKHFILKSDKEDNKISTCEPRTVQHQLNTISKLLQSSENDKTWAVIEMFRYVKKIYALYGCHNTDLSILSRADLHNVIASKWVELSGLQLKGLFYNDSLIGIQFIDMPTDVI